MAPLGDPSDGHFDLCIVSEVNRPRIFGLIPHFLKGDQAGEPEITNGRTDRIKVNAISGILPAHCDGETLCEEGQELSMEIVPSALEIITAEINE